MKKIHKIFSILAFSCSRKNDSNNDMIKSNPIVRDNTNSKDFINKLQLNFCLGKNEEIDDENYKKYYQNYGTETNFSISFILTSPKINYGITYPENPDNYLKLNKITFYFESKKNNKSPKVDITYYNDCFNQPGALKRTTEFYINPLFMTKIINKIKKTIKELEENQYLLYQIQETPDFLTLESIQNNTNHIDKKLSKPKIDKIMKSLYEDENENNNKYSKIELYPNTSIINYKDDKNYENIMKKREALMEEKYLIKIQSLMREEEEKEEQQQYGNSPISDSDIEEMISNKNKYDEILVISSEEEKEKEEQQQYGIPTKKVKRSNIKEEEEEENIKPINNQDKVKKNYTPYVSSKYLKTKTADKNYLTTFSKEKEEENKISSYTATEKFFIKNVTSFTFISDFLKLKNIETDNFVINYQIPESLPEYTKIIFVAAGRWSISNNSLFPNIDNKINNNILVIPVITQNQLNSLKLINKPYLSYELKGGNDYEKRSITAKRLVIFEFSEQLFKKYITVMDDNIEGIYSEFESFYEILESLENKIRENNKAVGIGLTNIEGISKQPAKFFVYDFETILEKLKKKKEKIQTLFPSATEFLLPLEDYFLHGSLQYLVDGIGIITSNQVFYTKSKKNKNASKCNSIEENKYADDWLSISKYFYEKNDIRKAGFNFVIKSLEHTYLKGKENKERFFEKILKFFEKKNQNKEYSSEEVKIPDERIRYFKEICLRKNDIIYIDLPYENNFNTNFLSLIIEELKNNHNLIFLITDNIDKIFSYNLPYNCIRICNSTLESESLNYNLIKPFNDFLKRKKCSPFLCTMNWNNFEKIKKENRENPRIFLNIKENIDMEGNNVPDDENTKTFYLKNTNNENIIISSSKRNLWFEC